MAPIPNSDAYQYLRFLFKIDYIQPTENAPEHCPNGHWHPPTSSRDFQTVASTGWFLRTPNEVKPVTDIIQGEHFDTCSLFYTSETGYYLGVPVDCRTSELEEWLNRYGRSSWNRVMFDHQAGNLSIMKFFAQNISLVGRGSRQWIPELVPEVYDLGNSSSQSPTTHLTGNLALIVAFIAFACPNMGDTDRLQEVMENCFRPPHWRPHQIPFRRLNRRGVVVSIRLDPNLDPFVSKELLEKFETGTYGPLIS